MKKLIKINVEINKLEEQNMIELISKSKNGFLGEKGVVNTKENL